MNQNVPLSPIMKASQDVIELRFCENTEPLTVSLGSGLTPHSLNSTLASLFEFGPTAAFSLSNAEKKSTALDLTMTEQFAPCVSGCSYFLTVKQSGQNIDERYDILKSSGESIKPSLSTEGFYLFASGQNTYNSYYFTLYLQRFLTRAFIDIIQNDASPLSKSLIPYLHPDAPTSIVRKKVITNVLVDVFTEVFGDTCLWEVNQMPSAMPQWKNLINFLTALIVKKNISFLSIKKAIVPFQPSKLSELLVIEISNALRVRMTDSEVFTIVSELFPDKFFINCFIKRHEIYNILLASDFPPILPFVTINCLVQQALKDTMFIEAANAIIQQIGHPGIFSSKRITKAVIDPLLNYVYSKVLNDELPYLEMSADQLNSIMSILNKMIPILKTTIKIRPIQYEALIRIQNILEKRGFEPKGLCFVYFAFLYDHEIIHPDVYNLYVQTTNCQSAGRNSVILEINSYLMTMVPGPFPPVKVETPFAKKGGLPPH